MRRRIFHGPLFIACLLMSMLAVLSPTLARNAAARDHLSPEEADQVREAQELDKRIEVFIKVAERRLLALTDTNAAKSKQVQKDLEKWGELPKGTRAELLTDLAKVLEEATTNIDDVSTRDPKNSLVPKALRKLAEASKRFLAQLTNMREQTQSDAEREALTQATENAQAVIEAADKLPPPTNEKKAKGKGSS